jgi:hypothetical protein
MPGTFRVVGTFRVAGRGLVAYGDVITGSVACRETLCISLNSSIAISVEIRSVEMVDDTPTGSHVALLIASSDELESSLVEGLNFVGETLEVSPADRPDDSGGQTFDEAVARLHQLLVAIGWPTEVTWVPNTHVVAFPRRVYVFQPKDTRESGHLARKAFAAALDDSIAVRVGVLGHCKGMTFATVWPIVELGQGEESFLEHRVKVIAPSDAPRLTIVKWNWRWSLVTRTYRAWREQVARSVRAG